MHVNKAKIQKKTQQTKTITPINPHQYNSVCPNTKTRFSSFCLNISVMTMHVQKEGIS